MLNLLKTFRCGVRRRGSALLIVLGFLSFMIISGVSFAIYMRIERQASSNYRHAVNARQVLNAALARAMEEVDSELRLDNTDVNDNDKKHPYRCELKLPFWWDGVNIAKPTRVRTSAVDIDA
jgi:type II secretory pathway component PulK